MSEQYFSITQPLDNFDVFTKQTKDSLQMISNHEIICTVFFLFSFIIV
jgi:hypothetical protein